MWTQWEHENSTQKVTLGQDQTRDPVAVKRQQYVSSSDLIFITTIHTVFQYTLFLSPPSLFLSVGYLVVFALFANCCHCERNRRKTHG